MSMQRSSLGALELTPTIGLPVQLVIAFAAALLASLFLFVSPALAENSFTAGSAPETETQVSESTPDAESANQEPKKESKYATVVAVELNAVAVKLKNNDQFQFEATLIPSIEGKKIKNNKKNKISWSVSNPKVARITETGLVQGKRTGTVTVTAKTGAGITATAKVKVKVNKKKMATKVPILTYHRIASNSAKNRFYQGESLAVSASDFRQQMEWLYANGYYTVSSSELRDWRVEGAFLPKKSVMITIDDGFYETYHVAYPILKRYGQKATSFIVGWRTPKTTRTYNPKTDNDYYVGRDVIKRLKTEYPNLEFQSHTYNMHYRGSSGNGIATEKSIGSLKADLTKNKKFGFTALAYPFGHTSSNFIKVLKKDKKIGIAFGYIMHWPATRNSPVYNMPRFKVMGDGSFDEFLDIVTTAG